MTLIDFKDNPKDLIGKLVLYEAGGHFNKTRSIHTITEVTKTGFRINSYPDYLFRLDTGRQKGTGKSMWETGSYCHLITVEYADKLRAEWAKSKEIKEIRSMITEKLTELSLDQLRKIKEIIS